MPTVQEIDVKTGRVAKRALPVVTFPRERKSFQPPRSKPGTMRLSNRNNRRRRQTNRQMMTPAIGNSNGMISTAPAAISEQGQGSFLKRAGVPVHPEYGPGAKFVGSALWGNLQVASGGSKIFSPIYAVSGDMFAISSYMNGWVYGIHPATIAYLAGEITSWGKYRFLKLKLRYHPMASSTAQNGVSIALSKDVQAPFTTGWSPGGDIPYMIPYVATSVWQRASVFNNSSSSSQKCWSTAYPTVDTASTSPGGTILAEIVEEYFQFILAGVASSGTFGANAFYGQFYLDYELDAFVPRYTSTNVLTPFLVPPTLGVTDEGNYIISKEDYEEALRRKALKPGHIDVTRSSRYAHHFRSQPSIPFPPDGKKKYSEILSEGKTAVGEPRSRSLERVPPPPKLVRQTRYYRENPDPMELDDDLSREDRLSQKKDSGL